MCTKSPFLSHFPNITSVLIIKNRILKSKSSARPLIFNVLTFYDFFNLPRSKKRCFSHSLKNYFIHAYLLCKSNLQNHQDCFSASYMNQLSYHQVSLWRSSLILSWLSLDLHSRSPHLLLCEVQNGMEALCQ